MDYGRVSRAPSNDARHEGASVGRTPTRQTNTVWREVAQRAPAEEATTTAVSNDNARRVVRTNRGLSLLYAALRGTPITATAADKDVAVTKEQIAAELAAVKAEALRYDDSVTDEAARERMVSTVVNYAIIATVLDSLSNVSAKADYSSSKALILESARLRVINEFRENKSIKNSSVNTIYRDAEYYLVGRYETLNRGDSAAAKAIVGVGGVVLNEIYNVKKRIVNQQENPDFPTSAPGGSGHTWQGSKAAMDEKGTDTTFPAIIDVQPLEDTPAVKP